MGETHRPKILYLVSKCGCLASVWVWVRSSAQEEVGKGREKRTGDEELRSAGRPSHQSSLSHYS